jgi:SpoVK/Ycf46/Vps4 family AAA+-type ATPase
VKESVELPLTHPELYEEMGIKPPKGVILYGVPGTGKTLLAKAVANQTSATFLRVVGSELIQKYLGDGPKLVRELFRVAEEHAPSIVFIDEIDAIGTKRCIFNIAHSESISHKLSGTIQHLEASAKFNEQCWNFSTSWMALTPGGTSKLSWRQTGLIPSILLSSALAELTGRSSSRYPM